MDLLAYFRVLRRHWVVLVAFAVVGGLLGGASTLLSSDDDPAAPTAEHYKATHTLLFKPGAGTSTYPSSFSNLEQIALLATTGPVPETVAKDLGGTTTAQQVSERLTTLTSASAGTIAVTAVGRQSDDTALLANTVADELVKSIVASDLEAYDEAKADAQKQLDALQSRIDATRGQLAAIPPPPNADLLAQQLNAYEDQYAQAFANYQQVAGKDAPVSPLKTLQQAQPVSIDVSEYDTRLAQGRLGQNNLQAGGSSPVAVTTTSSSTSLDGPVPRIAFGAFFGLLLGIGFVMLRDRLDRRVRSRDDAEQAYRWPVLADVPLLSPRQADDHEIVSATTPMSPVTEAYRSVRSSILFQLATAARQPVAAETGAGETGPDGIFEPRGSECVVVMLASAQPGDGKTTSAANLATVCAQAGARVLVVNCDFRRPMIHEFFGAEDLPRRVQATSVPGVSLVTNVVREPDPNPAQVVALQRQVVAAARDRFDVIVLDTAPILGANDAIDLVGEVDVVVVVARVHSTSVPAAQRAAESLRRVDAPVAGVVLVGSAEGENSYYAAYHRDTKQAAKSARQGRGRKRGDDSADARPVEDARTPAVVTAAAGETAAS